MRTNRSEWWANTKPRSAQFAFDAEAARHFHRSIPGYEPSPLVEVKELAEELGVGRLFVKDESSRFGLPSFKVLGASWAVANVVVGKIRSAADITWEETLAAAVGSPMTLVTATDGNHGRAVAWMARNLGLESRIFVPSAISDESGDAIASEGADVVRIDGDYDDAVRLAAGYATSTEGAELVQDMSWEGYEEVPSHIVDGYGTLLSEIEDTLSGRGAVASLVVVPVGVGSLAQSVVSHYRSKQNGAAVLGVEPVTAACLLGSLEAGELTTVPTSPTVMAGLYCATPSAAAWDVLSVGMDAVVTVDDDSALEASDDLIDLRISSGPSGASALAGARAALRGSSISGASQEQRRFGLHVDDDSVVVLLSTEARR